MKTILKTTLFAFIILGLVAYSSENRLVRLSNASVEKLRNGVWLVLVHSSSCTDLYCSSMQRAFLLLLKKPVIKAAGIQLATLDSDKNRIAKRVLGATGEQPQIFLVQDHQVFQSQEPFGSLKELEKFALSRGEGMLSFRTLDDDLERDFGPTTCSLTSVVVLLIGMTFIGFLIKGRPFDCRSMKEIEEAKNKNEKPTRLRRKRLSLTNENQSEFSTKKHK